MNPLAALPPLVPVLVFSCGVASETWPDFHEDDKREHGLVGVAVGMLGTTMAERLMPDAPWWQKALVGVAASAVVGIAKEQIDAHRSADTNDRADATATVIGGVAGSLAITLAWHF